MQTVVFALLGAAAGFLLDHLVALLAASAPEEEPEAEEVRPLTLSPGEAGQARVGAFVGEGPIWRRPALMAAAAASFGAASARYGEPEQAAVVSAYAVVLIACAATDLMAFRVPNVITYPAAAGAILIAVFMPHGDLTQAWIGGALATGLFLAAAVVSRGGLGLGDVKLAGFVGLALGFPLILPALMITALSGGLVAAYLGLRFRRRNHPMPYAPYISAGALVVLLWQGSTFATL